MEGEGGEPEARVVHLDDDLAVVDKPAGLVVHPAASYTGITLVEQLDELLGGGEDPTRPGIVHRLDRDTSGLLVVARNEETLRALQAAIRERRVERQYTALVKGSPGSRTGTVEASLGRSNRDRQKMTVGGAGAREARTHFTVLERYGDESLCELRLDTGRTHQIRVHMAAIGHPLIGDATNGGPARHGLRRQFLHAHRLAFSHPRDGRSVEFCSELPEDLDAALALARAPLAREG